MFPLSNYKYSIPQGDDLGAFAVGRKHDVHTGVDLYCEQYDKVYAIEDGVIIAIAPFTGKLAGYPWWNDTLAIVVHGASGYVNYGELYPNVELREGDRIREGTELGFVMPVLMKDKGKVPSTSMLHMELYSSFNGEFAEWLLGEEKPPYLEDPTPLLTLLNKS